MSYSMMEALFDGRVIPWERRAQMSDKHKAIEEQIETEKRHFIQKMSLDDCERFEKLTDLIRSAEYCEEVGIYSHGFTLGMFLMLETMENKEAIICE